MTSTQASHPPTMKAWLYSATSGGLEKHLTLNPSAGTPPPLQPHQVLIQVITASLNPADYKVPELGAVTRLMRALPASPGMDYCGRVVAVGLGVDEAETKPGDLVYGCLGMPGQFGSLGEYVVGNQGMFTSLPDGVEPDHAATVGVTGMTAYQSIEPYVSAGKGEKVFVNGGSGGCGIYVIQIAKILGCHVTTTCSTRNVEFCKDLGADEVIDYTRENVVQALEKQGQVYSHVVDHIGSPSTLYAHCHNFLLPGKTFVQVGAASFLTFANRLIRPGFLGGGKRKFHILMMKQNIDHLRQIGEWMREGKIKVTLDSTYEYSDAVEAIVRLRSGRARGKVVVHVTDQ